MRWPRSTKFNRNAQNHTIHISQSSTRVAHVRWVCRAETKTQWQTHKHVLWHGLDPSLCSQLNSKLKPDGYMWTLRTPITLKCFSTHQTRAIFCFWMSVSLRCCEHAHALESLFIWLFPSWSGVVKATSAAPKMEVRNICSCSTELMLPLLLVGSSLNLNRWTMKLQGIQYLAAQTQRARVMKKEYFYKLY